MSNENRNKLRYTGAFFQGGEGVYLDLVITLNVVVNFLLLKITGQVARQKTTLLRLLLGSALGGMLLVFLIQPIGALLLMSWPGKLLLPIAMVTLAYRPRRCKDAILLVLLFYFCSFVLAGLVMSLLLWNNYTFDLSHKAFSFSPPSLSHLFWAGVVLLLVVQVASPLLGEKFKLHRVTKDFQVEVVFCGKKKQLSAFLDTGNMLKEPFSGSPVAVAEYRAIAELLPPEIRGVLKCGTQINWEKLEKALSSCGAAVHFRLIPYRSLHRNDYMVAFRPEKIKIMHKGREIMLEKGLMVAITQQQFSSREEFEMLLPLDVYIFPEGEER
ncbi:MAG: sigma-E processing peptidase SpoIIGA [Firmicutes bacterium]|nr:sigma-E processing peptidase SpoIIGA [Bacillota bacterium]